MIQIVKSPINWPDIKRILTCMFSEKNLKRRNAREKSDENNSTKYASMYKAILLINFIIIRFNFYFKIRPSVCKSNATFQPDKS